MPLPILKTQLRFVLCLFLIITIVSISYSPAEVAGATSNIIAFSTERDGNHEIYVMRSDGNGIKRLTNHPATDTSPTWSPDGSAIAFASNRQDTSSHRMDIYILEIANLEVRRFTNTGGSHPSWSPDGRYIAFEDYSGRIFTKDVVTSEIKYITQGWQPNWTADSSTLVFGAIVGVGVEPIWGVSTIRLGQTTATNLRTVERQPNPASSPTDGTIAFVDFYGSGNKVTLMNSDGSNPRLLPGQEDLQGTNNPAWSPDAMQVAFDLYPNIYVINRDGTDLKLLAEGMEPVWKPTSSPLELTGFIVDSYVERGQCYDVLVVLRNNTEAAITRRIDLTEQAAYFNGRDERAPLPSGRQDRFVDCDTGAALNMQGTITRSLTVPAQSTATLRLRLRHDWDWIERQTIASAVFDLVSKEVQSAVLSIGFGSLGEAIDAFGNLEDLAETIAGVSSARPSAHYAYALSIEGLVPPAAKTVEVRVNELQIGFYRGSLAASIEAMGLCPFAYVPWIAPGCIFATATSKALYLSAYGEVSLTEMPAQSNTYRELATPQPITLTALDALTDRDQRAYVERQIAIDALRRAAVESLRRAALAEAADDRTWNLRQRQHARKLLEEAADQLDEVRSSADALVTDIASPTPTEIAAYQVALANTGFNETTQSVFADIGIAIVEQEALKSYLLALTVEDWPDPSIIPVLHELQQREMLSLARTVAPTVYLPLVRR